MVGGVFDTTTVTVNAGRAVESWPSLAAITMPGYVPACDADGVPLSVPVAVSKLAQVGLPEIEKVSGWPSGSEADGLKL